MVFALTDEITFPDPHYGDPDGLLAVGGDLSTDRLILAYSNGIFPWYTFQEGMIQWWCPLERFVIFPDEIHISHSHADAHKQREVRCHYQSGFR